MTESLTMLTIIQRAGGCARIADCAGIDRTTPYRWKQVPARHAAAIAKLIGVAPEQIRPDVFPPSAAREDIGA